MPKYSWPSARIPAYSVTISLYKRLTIFFSSGVTFASSAISSNSALAAAAFVAAVLAVD